MSGRLEGPVGPVIRFDGREFDYFGGSGYLGLQSHLEVLRAAQEALERYGFSTATSRGGLGEHPLFDELEREACAFFGSEKIIHLPSGYLGPAVLVQTSGAQYDHIFIDADAHHSLWDAAQSANRLITPFPHRRPERLAEILRAELRPGERPLLLSDGLFPISGEIAPLPGYLAAVREYGGMVYLDDAHAAGVLGSNGRGTAEYFRIDDPACRSSATLAKALGGSGGILWGSAAWIEHTERSSRICAGSSPAPLVSAAASAKGLFLARTQPDLRERLRANTARLREGLRGQGWEVEESPSPVICLRGGAEVSLERIRSELYRQGIAIELVRSYPSAPPGGGLRIAACAGHTPAQIERLLDAVRRAL